VKFRVFSGAVALALMFASSVTASAVTTTTVPGSSVLVYVAMGDSYSSGVGNVPYSNSSSTFVASGTASAGVQVSSPGNSLADGCDRSALAQGSFATSVALSLGMTSYTDVACSGATSTQMLRANHGEPAQIRAVSSKVTLVTLTAGGNDAPSWESVVEKCVDVVITPRLNSAVPYYEKHGFFPGSQCAAAVAAKEAALATVGTTNLTALYRQILSRMAPTGRLVVVPYPTLVPLAAGRSCLLTPTFPVARKTWGQAVGLSSVNYGRLAGMVKAMDAAISAAASAATGTGPSRIVVAPVTGLSGWLNCQPWTERLHPSGLHGMTLLSGGLPPTATSGWIRPCLALSRLTSLSHQYAACVAAAWIARVTSSLQAASPIIANGSLHPTPTGQSQLAGAVLTSLNT
jgi:GDSL-like Lipase/Acylhydrolase family